ncbi:MAG: family 1 glycosylhydrolase [Nanopusillaceae archaeon]
MDKNFYLGFSISAFQTEGYYDYQDWYYFIKKGKLPEVENANRLWERYEDLVPILKDLHANAFRFSIDWSRIYNRKERLEYRNLYRYIKFIELLKKNDIEPFITLWHYVNPIWFYEMGGFEYKENVEYFIEFAENIIRILTKMDVKYFISFNEPWIYVISSYIVGTWPPFKKASDINSLKTALNVLSNIRYANDEIYKIAKQNDAYLIYTENLSLIKLPFFIPSKDIIINNIRIIFPEKIDFYGINYYGIYKNMDDIINRKPIFDVSFISNILKDLDKPVFITENGINTEDEFERVRILKKYIYYFVKNRERYKIKGYFIWSLMDNYEWDVGYTAKFGILNRDLSKKDSYYEIKNIYGKLNESLNNTYKGDSKDTNS